MLDSTPSCPAFADELGQGTKRNFDNVAPVTDRRGASPADNAISSDGSFPLNRRASPLPCNHSPADVNSSVGINSSPIRPPTCPPVGGIDSVCFAAAVPSTPVNEPQAKTREEFLKDKLKAAKEAVARKTPADKSTCVEVFCGCGELSEALANRGFDALGIDCNQNKDRPRCKKYIKLDLSTAEGLLIQHGCFASVSPALVRGPLAMYSDRDLSVA